MAVQEHFIDLSLGRTRYLESGSGEPLLMLHGMGMSNSAHSFDPVLPGLARHFRVLAPDLLGFGKGEREVREGPTFELILEQLREFLERLELKRVNLAAHSMGGWVAGHLAYQSPERVKKLALLNAAGLNSQPAPNVKAMEQVPPLEKEIELVRAEFHDKTRATDEFVQRMARVRHGMLSMPNALHSLDTLLHMMHVPELRSRYMLHRRLRHIGVPALVLWGTADVMDPYPTWTSEYSRLGGDLSKSSKPWIIPGARYVMADTGHYTHWEMPDYTVGLLADFFKGAKP